MALERSKEEIRQGTAMQSYLKKRGRKWQTERLIEILEVDSKLDPQDPLNSACRDLRMASNARLGCV